MHEGKAINDILDELKELGLATKLGKVLSLPARYFLVDLIRKQFGFDTADAIHLKGSERWYDYTLDEKTSIELKDRWKGLANADPDDQILREECVILSRLVRKTVYNLRSAYWRITVDEHHLLYLAEAIDSSLRPRLFDRIRQLFDK